jgi:hypothetical protein
MAQKFLYVLESYLPAPHSYGGIINIIAEDDDECFDLMVQWDNEQWPEYYGKLRENILKAPRFSLAEQSESYVVEACLVQ